MHLETTEHVPLADLEDRLQLIQVLPQSVCDIPLEGHEMQSGLLQNGNDAFTASQTASLWM